MLQIRKISEVKSSSKNGRKYLTVTFGTKLEDGVLDNTRTSVRNVWEQYTDDKDRTFRGDPMFDQIMNLPSPEKAVGLTVKAASIETTDCEPYEINGREVKTFTSVVFAGETIQSLAAAKVRQSQKASAPSVV